MTPSHVRVMLCGNDKNGLSTEIVKLDIVTCLQPFERPLTVWREDIALELVAPGNLEHGTHFDRKPGKIRVGRQWYAITGYQTCVGSIFWDCATMHYVAALALLRSLRGCGWTVDSASDLDGYRELLLAAGCERFWERAG